MYNNTLSIDVNFITSNVRADKVDVDRKVQGPDQRLRQDLT